jgi:hypothetical protein
MLNPNQAFLLVEKLEISPKGCFTLGVKDTKLKSEYKRWQNYFRQNLFFSKFLYFFKENLYIVIEIFHSRNF